MPAKSVAYDSFTKQHRQNFQPSDGPRRQVGGWSDTKLTRAAGEGARSAAGRLLLLLRGVNGACVWMAARMAPSGRTATTLTLPTPHPSPPAGEPVTVEQQRSFLCLSLGK